MSEESQKYYILHSLMAQLESDNGSVLQNAFYFFLRLFVKTAGDRTREDLKEELSSLFDVVYSEKDDIITKDDLQ